MHGQDRLMRRLARILTNRAAAPGRVFEIELDQLFLSDSGSENFFPYEQSVYSNTAARRVWHCYRTPTTRKPQTGFQRWSQGWRSLRCLDMHRRDDPTL